MDSGAFISPSGTAMARGITPALYNSCPPGALPSCTALPCIVMLPKDVVRLRWEGSHVGTVASSKKKCFSIALRHTLVVLEMH